RKRWAVCIENLIHFDCVTESHSVGDDGCATEHRYEPAPLHSITSSARASSVSGRVRPSVLAVSQRANSWTPDGSLDRPIALYRHTAAGTDLGVIIPQRHVLNAAIVPERDRVGPPAKPHLEFRPGAVFE